MVHLQPPTTVSHDVDPRSLRQFSLFAALSDTDLVIVAAATHTEQRGRGDISIGDDEAGATIYVVIKGRVRLYRLAPGGDAVMLHTLQAGEPFALGRCDQAETLCDNTLLYRLPRPLIERLVAAHPPVALALCALLYERLDAAYERIVDLKLGTIPIRLGRLLERLWQANGGQLVQVSHQELADLIGAQPADVTKTLRHLRERGLISYQPHHRGITVLDPAALASL